MLSGLSVVFTVVVLRWRGAGDLCQQVMNLLLITEGVLLILLLQPLSQLNTDQTLCLQAEL